MAFMYNYIDVLFSYYNTAIKKDAFFDLTSYILHHLNRVEEISMKELTENCFTSPTTVNKYCQMFGFVNLKSLQQQLKVGIYMKNVQVPNRLGNFNVDDIYRIYETMCHDGYKMSKEELLNKTEKIADLIYQHDQIVFYGSIYPLSLLANLQYDLCMAGKMIKHIHLIKKKKEKNSLQMICCLL